MWIAMTGPVFRWGRFLGAASICLIFAALAFLYDMPQPADPVDEQLKSFQRRLAESSPEAANKLEDLRMEGRKLPLAAALEAEHDRSGMSGVRNLLNTSPWKTQFASLITGPGVPAGASSAAAHSHGAALTLLDSAGPSLAAKYMEQLEIAAADPDVWPLVRSDPVALQLFADPPAGPYAEEGDKLETLEFYHKHRKALEPVVLAVAAVPQVAEVDGELTSQVADEAASDPAIVELRFDFKEVPDTAYANHPHYLTAIQHLPDNVPAETLAAVHYAFVDYSELLSKLAELGVPIHQAVEFAFANGESLNVRLDDADASAVASELKEDLRDAHPVVWEQALQGPLAWDLHREAPRSAAAVLEQFGSDDVAAFLFTYYPDELAPAAEALERFDNLAFGVLGFYKGDDRFRDLLARDDIDARLIPYAAIWGNVGLEELETDKAYLDKRLDEDGEPVESGVWESLPGGAAVTVVKNWRNGVPNDWNELGWATLDVAEGALLVASLGSSASVTVVTTTAKTGGKAGVKTATRKVGRTWLKENFESASQRIGRRISKRTREPLLRRFARTEGRLARVTKGSRTVWAHAVQPISTVAGKVSDAAKTARRAWTRLPPRVKRWTYRGMLGAGLFATIVGRTLPALENFANDLPAIAAGWVKKLEPWGGSLLDAIERLTEIRPQVSIAPVLLFKGLCLVPAGLFACLAWRWRPFRRRRPTYV